MLPRTIPILSAKQLGNRWQRHPETIANYVQAGILKPVFTAGKQMSFALADIQKIEAGNLVEQPGHDLTIPALTYSDRTNPVILTRRVGLACQAIDAVAAVQSMGGAGAGMQAKNDLRRAAAALRCQATGVEAPRLPAPAFGPSESRGIKVEDYDSPPKLFEMAYAAVMHMLMSAEARDTIADFGPHARQRFLLQLDRLEELISYTFSE